MTRLPVVLRLSLAVAVAAVCVPVPAHAATPVTLRVAPMGFVVPSHWAVGNAAVWVVDPVAHREVNDLPGVAGCEVPVDDLGSDGAVDGGDVLDASVAAGCISGWTAEAGSFGRFVTAVDGLEQGAYPAGWWAIQVDGVSSPFGIDDLDLAAGASLELVYMVAP